MRLSTHLLLLGMLAVFAATAHADDVTLTPCSCGDDAPFIDQAIAIATHNGTVRGTVVLAGTFELSQPVILVLPGVTIEAGPAGATIDAPGLIAFDIQGPARGLVIRGLTINSRIGLRKLLQVFSGAANDVTFEGNIVNYEFRGVSQFEGDDPSTGWLIKNNQLDCVGSCSAGIFVTGINGVIEGNTINDGSLGILVQNNLGAFGTVTVPGGMRWSIKENTVSAVDIAIWLNGASFNHLAKNRSDTTGFFGILLQGGLPARSFLGQIATADSNQLTQNVVSNKTGAGILLGESAIGNSVSRNQLENDSIGIDLGLDSFAADFGAPTGPAASNQVHANQITAGDVGILLRQNTLENVVTGNASVGATPPLQGIVQESTAAGNIVRGNPGFMPVTGAGHALHAPHLVLLEP